MAEDPWELISTTPLSDFQPEDPWELESFTPLDAPSEPSFTDSFIRSAGDTLPGLGGAFVEATGEGLGIETLTNYGRDVRERNKQEAEETPKLTSFQGITDPGSFWDWVKETAGEQLPLMAPSVAGAGAGAVLGAPLGPVGATVGGLVGAFVPSYVLGVGEVQQNIKEKGGTSPTAAFVGGTAIAALDTILPGKVGGKLVGKLGVDAAEAIAQRALWKRVGAETLKGSATEGVTEAIQEAVGEVSAALGTDTPVELEKLKSQMIEAGAAGALFGGGVQGVTAAVPQRARPTPLDPDAILNSPGVAGNDFLKAAVAQVKETKQFQAEQSAAVADLGGMTITPASSKVAEEIIAIEEVAKNTTDPAELQAIEQRLNTLYDELEAVEAAPVGQELAVQEAPISVDPEGRAGTAQELEAEIAAKQKELEAIGLTPGEQTAVIRRQFQERVDILRQDQKSPRKLLGDPGPVADPSTTVFGNAEGELGTYQQVVSPVTGQETPVTPAPIAPEVAKQHPGAPVKGEPIPDAPVVDKVEHIGPYKTMSGAKAQATRANSAKFKPFVEKGYTFEAKPNPNGEGFVVEATPKQEAVTEPEAVELDGPGTLTKEQLPIGVTDTRFLREDFRLAIRQMASELDEGGGGAGTLILDENGKPGGRAGSSNPEWFQGFSKSAKQGGQKPTVKYVQDTMDKVFGVGKKGELGKRQIELVSEMMDYHQEQSGDRRTDIPVTEPKPAVPTDIEAPPADAVVAGPKRPEAPELSPEAESTLPDTDDTPATAPVTVPKTVSATEQIEKLQAQAEAIDEDATENIVADNSLSETDVVKGLQSIIDSEGYGASNKFVSKEQYEKVVKSFDNRVKNTTSMNAMFNPANVKELLEMGVFHLEAMARANKKKWIANMQAALKNFDPFDGRFGMNGEEAYAAAREQLQQKRNPKMRELTGDLSKVQPEIKKAVDDVLGRMSQQERDRVGGNLEKHKGTSWAMATVKSLAIREMFHRAQNNGDALVIAESKVWGKEKLTKYEMVRSFLKSDAALKKFASGYNFLGTNRKTEIDMPGSFVSCNPTFFCASGCYASNTTARNTELLGAEFTEYMSLNEENVVVDSVLRNYLGTPQEMNGLALRLNDKGDLSESQLKVIAKLNKRGVRLQIFSKRPELLAKVDPDNLRLLSIDSGNISLAEANPEFQLAVTVTDDLTTTQLDKIIDRVGVYFPVNLKGDSLSRGDLKKRFPDQYSDMRLKVCPVDGELMSTAKDGSFVSIINRTGDKGVWTCAACDFYGSAGCFNGENQSAQVRKAEQLFKTVNSYDANTVQSEYDALRSELKRSLRSGDIDANQFRQISAILNQKPSDPRKEPIPGTEEEVSATGDQGSGEIGESTGRAEATPGRVTRAQKTTDTAETNRDLTQWKQDVEDTISPLVAEWKGLPHGKIEVLERFGDLPTKTQEAVRKKIGKDRVSGFYHNGKVYLVAENIKTDEGAFKTALHEVRAHYGLRNLFGGNKELNTILDSIARAPGFKDRMAAKAVQYELNEVDQGDRRIAAEELLADFAEQNINMGFVKRARRVVKQLLNNLRLKLGMKEWEFTDDDAHALLASSERKLRRVGKNWSDSLVRAAAAWHGTPHEVDRFSTGKIGTGEGAQAFGWGLYFAGKKSVAEWYRDSLAPSPILVGGVPVKDADISSSAKTIATSIALGNKSLAIIKGEQIEALKINRLRKQNLSPTSMRHALVDRRIRDARQLLAATRELEGMSITRGETSGKLLGVELAPKEHEYLRWDLPTDKQSKKVQKILADAGYEATNVEEQLKGEHEFIKDSATALLKSIGNAQTFAKEELKGDIAKLDELVRIGDVKGYSDALGFLLDQYAFLEPAVLKNISTDLATTNRAISDLQFNLEDVDNIQPLNGRLLYNRLVQQEGGQEKASKKLLSLGIRGIKYPEGSLSGVQKPTDFNYVIFDDSDVEITSRARKEEEAPPKHKKFDSSVGKEIAKQKATAKRGTVPNGPFIKEWNTPETTLREDMFNRFVFEAQNSFESLGRAQKTIEESRGEKLDDDTDVLLRETIYRGKVAEEIDIFKKKHIEPLVEAIHDTGLTLAQVQDYLHARHAEEANAVLEKRNPGKENLSGLSNEQAAEILAKPEVRANRGKLFRIAKRVDAITKSRRELLVSSGLERQETIDQWESTYKKYVPLMREDGGKVPSSGKGFSIKGKESKARTGSTRKVVNILAEIEAQHEMTIQRAEKVKVGRALLKLAEENPNPDIWTVDKIEYTPRIGKDGLVIRGINPLFKEADNVLVVKTEHGERHITFNKDNQDAMRMATAMKNLGASDSGWLVRQLSRVNRFLGIVNTSANPEFVISNFARDIQTAGFNLNDTEAREGKRSIFKSAPSMFRGIFRAEMKGDTTSEEAKHWLDFKKAGAKTGWVDQITDMGERSSNLEKQLRIMEPTKLGSFRRAWKALAETVYGMNTVVENGIRLSTFVYARDSLGLSTDKAASIAKELTVNFNRRGNMGPTMNAFYLFFNAGVQGSARILKASKNPTVRKMMIGAVGFAAMLDMFNRSISEDDEGENCYDKIKPWIKERNMIIMTGCGNAPIKIPLPYGYNVFHVLGQAMGKVATGEVESYTDEAMHVLGSAMSAFNPLGGEASVAQFLSPTITDPLIQWETNKDWAGRPLRPTQNPFTAPTPEHARYFNSVSTPSRVISKTLSDLTGGSKSRPGAVEISPELFDLAFDNVVGGLGKFVKNTVDLPLKLAQGEEVPVHKIPLVRKLAGVNIEFHDREVFYDNLREIQIVETEIKQARTDRDGAELARLRKEHRGKLRLVAASKRFRKIVSRMSKQIKAAGISKERKKLLEAKRNSIMKSFNKKMKLAAKGN
jgi:hypothetical protein